MRKYIDIVNESQVAAPQQPAEPQTEVAPHVKAAQGFAKATGGRVDLSQNELANGNHVVVHDNEEGAHAVQRGHEKISGMMKKVEKQGWRGDDGYETGKRNPSSIKGDGWKTVYSHPSGVEMHHYHYNNKVKFYPAKG